MSNREQIRKLGQKETIKNKWIMENNNFRYFNDKGELIVHLFKHQNSWKGFVLGHNGSISRNRFTDALEDIHNALKECGWEK